MSNSKYHVDSKNVHSSLKEHILADGYDLVLDLERSNGSKIYDKRNGKEYLDLFSCFASMPIGYNHPEINNDEFISEIGKIALNKPSNSDLYTEEYASFVNAFHSIALPDHFKYSFYISGGSLAVENALKAAFDWKVQKNFKKGYEQEKGHKVIYFNEAFHGRSGYTMTLTNTDPIKVEYFPKFDWIKVDNPKIDFDNPDQEDLIRREQASLNSIKEVFANNKDDIAAIIIEPVQGEGGDNHFRTEYLQAIKDLCIENDALLIFDEVQTGVGITGTWWAHQNLDVIPDIMAFGKKMQVCGIVAGERIDEVESNVFHRSSRINSTWGANLVDMVRSQRYLEIIQENNYLDNVNKMSEYLMSEMKELQNEFPDVIGNPRANGLFAAFDLKKDIRNEFLKTSVDKGLLILSSGKNSIRFRPHLNVSEKELHEGLGIIKDVLKFVL